MTDRIPKPYNKTRQIYGTLSGLVSQDGVLSPLRRSVQAPVKICVIKDSLQRVCVGAGAPCWSRHIVAIDREAINTSNIHIVGFISLVSFLFLVTSFLCGREDHPHQRTLPLQRGPQPNGLLDACFQVYLLSRGANRGDPYFHALIDMRSFQASN